MSPMSVCIVEAVARPGSIMPWVSWRPTLNCMSTGTLLPASPASGRAMVRVPEGGIVTSSIDQRPPSSGLTFAVIAASPAGLASPGIGQAIAVVVMLACNPPWQVRQRHRRPQQAGEPVLQLLLQSLRLCGTYVIGSRGAREQEQQAESS